MIGFRKICIQNLPETSRTSRSSLNSPPAPVTHDQGVMCIGKKYWALRGLQRIPGIQKCLFWVDTNRKCDSGQIPGAFVTDSSLQLQHNKRHGPTSVTTPGKLKGLDEWLWPKSINTQTGQAALIPKFKLSRKPSWFLTVLSTTHRFCNHLTYYIRPPSRADTHIILKHIGSTLLREELGDTNSVRKRSSPKRKILWGGKKSNKRKEVPSMSM